MKRKIVKRFHKNGDVGYSIKKRVFPFIWITESECMGYYTLVYRGMPLNHAIAVMNRLNKEDEERKGRKVIKTEDI